MTKMGAFREPESYDLATWHAESATSDLQS